MVTLIEPNNSQEEAGVVALGGCSCPTCGTRSRRVLSEAAKEQWTYLEFLGRDPTAPRWTPSRASSDAGWGCGIAHFPCVRTIEGFDFSFQPSADERVDPGVVHGKFHREVENVLIFGPPWHRRCTPGNWTWGRKVVEQGYTVRFTTATALLSVLGKAQSERKKSRGQT